MGERGRDIFLKFGPQNFDNVVFCAPPSGNEDYTQEVSASGARVAESGERRRLEVPRGEGGRVAKRRLIGVHGCSRGRGSIVLSCLVRQHTKQQALNAVRRRRLHACTHRLAWVAQIRKHGYLK
jgi:hypothetical protein